MTETPATIQRPPETVWAGRQETLFDALVHARRRFVFHYLLSETGTVALSTLAEEIAAQKAVRADADDACPEVAAVEMELSHKHVPKLNATDLVEYDHVQGTSTDGPGIDDVRPSLYEGTTHHSANR